MIRRCQLNITFANTGKKQVLDEVFEESRRVLQEYIDTLWDKPTKNQKYVDFKVDSWLSARLKQCLGKQALGIVKSAKTKKKSRKPAIQRASIELDSRFTEFLGSSNSFDIWVKLSSIGNKIKLFLPSKKHEHYNSFIKEGWNLKKFTRLRKVKNNYYIDVFFEKKEPDKKNNGNIKGIDIGYKKLIVSSDEEFIGKDFETIVNKITRKKHKSKGFKRSLEERDNYINKCVNELDLERTKVLVVEKLKNVKKNSKKKRKIRTKFMNKLQRWTYSKLLSRLRLRCEREGVLLVDVGPAYTSQTCSQCGNKDKNSRCGENFKCTTCGYSADADYNASLNILAKHLDEELTVPRKTSSEGFSI